MKGLELFEEEINEKLKELEEMEISSQELADKNWEILKQFRKPTKRQGKYEYWFLLRCKKCGFIKLYSKKNVSIQNQECKGCSVLEPVGKTYGCYKVLDFEYAEKHGNRIKKFYKVQCIRCKKEYIKELNKNTWCTLAKCKYCTTIPSNHGVSIMFSDYKQSAKDRNISFNLSAEKFLEISQKNCIYCGQEPEKRIINHRHEIYANGVDRIDSNKGYFEENCVPCCKTCNYMKSNLPLSVFLKHVHKIHKFVSNEGSTTIEKLLVELSTSQANGDGNGENPIVLD